MRRNLSTFLAWLAALAVLTLVLRSQTDPMPSIQWEWRGGRILERYDGNTKLQIGLHPDGFVMWREVTFETNSPAERQFRRNRMNPQFVPPVPEPSTNRIRFLHPTNTTPANANVLPPPLPQ